MRQEIKFLYFLLRHAAKHFKELELTGIKPTIIAPNFLYADKQIKSGLK